MALPPPIALSMEDPAVDKEVAGWVEVLFDGQPQTQVIAYDCRAGTVTRYRTDHAGNALVLYPSAELQVESLTGHVEARWRAGTPPA